PMSVEILDAIVDDYQTRATQKGIILYYEPLPPDTSWILADKQTVRQIFENLISNAVKYSPPWKQVWVRVKHTEFSGKKMMRVEVQDEGPGLSEEDKSKLFQKFARLSAQPTGGENSTGLGLSIVKKLVELQQGRVWCESTLGKGATFIVEFPLIQHS
ncbi:MAG: sensor histidine kinase, partial [Candidatus Kapaibacteriota bacterium]